MKLILPLVFLLLSVQIFAQTEVVSRIEIESKQTRNETITHFGENGFLFSNESVDRSNRNLNFEIYSNTLEKVSNFSVTVGRLYFYELEAKTTNNIFQLHSEKIGNYTFLNIDMRNRKLKSFNGEFPPRMVLSSMQVMNDYCYILGTQKKESVIIKIDVNSGEHTITPIVIADYKPKNITIQNMQLLEKENEIFLTIKVRVSRKESYVYIQKIAANGEQFLSFLEYFSPNGEQLVDMSFSKIGKNNYTITGTYSTSGNSSSEGIFFAFLNDLRIEKISYYNFINLDDFLSFLPQKRQEKIKRKKRRKSNRGKEYALSYNIAQHEVKKLKDGSYLFLGEAYYPTYTSYTTYSANGTPTTQQVFDGYRYTHAVAAKFNADGELVWDNCFKMYPSYKPFTVKKFITVNIDNEDYLSMLFAANKTIVSKSISYENGKVLQDRQSETLELSDQEKLKYSHINLDYWYENNFILFGNQTIKDKSARFGSKRRRIFFISKIKHEL